MSRATLRDLTPVHGIPCSTVARTLVDLAGVVRPDTLQRACEQAEVLDLFNLREVKEVLERSRGRRGVARLRGVLADVEDEPAFTRSELERRFLALCRCHGLPRPAVNAWVELPGDGLEVDFLWAEQGVVAEVDGFRFHSSRWAFERDRLRIQKLRAAGFDVVPFTWRQLAATPAEMAATLTAVLAPAGY